MFLQTLCVWRCLELLCDRNENVNLMQSSARVAEVIYGTKSIFSYKALTIRKWLHYYCEYGHMQQYVQGKHIKTHSIITDENVQKTLKNCLRAMNDRDRTPDKFMRVLNDTILQQFVNGPDRISLSTARKWMRYLNFSLESTSKGWYTDGHERPDVVTDRENFLRYDTSCNSLDYLIICKCTGKC